jgi:hypothetical protein
MRFVILFSIVNCILSNIAAQPKIKISFTPAGSAFAAAAKEYEEIWNQEGERIIKALEKASGMKFIDTAITAIVMEAPSSSGWMEKPMILRASYSANTKKGTLVHELGHRLHAFLGSHPDSINDHDILFLYLYDVWTSLYGEDFAKEQVAVESNRNNPSHDYRKMWETALSISREERQKKIQEFVTRYKAL